MKTSVVAPDIIGIDIARSDGELAKIEPRDEKRELIVRELSRIAFGDIRRLYNDDGSLKNVNELDEEAASALAGVDVSTVTKYNQDGDGFDVTIKKVKKYDKVKALELLARLYGLIHDDKSVNVNITLEALVAASFKK